MVTNFKFSDGARLYAQNSDLIDEMWELSQAEIRSFLDSVETNLRAVITEDLFESEPSKVIRVWFVTSESTPEDYEDAYVWIDQDDVKIINPGQLTLHVDYRGNDKATLERIDRLYETLTLPKNCAKKKRGKFFTVTISYNDAKESDAISLPASQLLLKLHDASTF